MSSFSLYLMSALCTVAGLLHFLKPRVYLNIMPPSLPYPAQLVWFSGLAEVVLGLGLFYPSTGTEEVKTKLGKLGQAV